MLAIGRLIEQMMMVGTVLIVILFTNHMSLIIAMNMRDDMIPEPLTTAIVLALIVYILHSLLEIYILIRAEYEEMKQLGQPKQPGGYFQ